jgi:hypothetical protein
MARPYPTKVQRSSMRAGAWGTLVEMLNARLLLRSRGEV